MEPILTFYVAVVLVLVEEMYCAKCKLLNWHIIKLSVVARSAEYILGYQSAELD